MDAENVADGGIRHRAYQVLSALETMDITRPHAPKGFVTRLAEQNGWTIARAEAADREYRRFLMLAWSTDDMVVPSRDVDAAWHEHLLHTRHYWDATCREILGKPFHHDPGDGSPVDADMHAAGYERTLALYERIFGEEAPMSVWPRGCSCDPQVANTREVELAMPAWTVLAAAALITLVMVRGMAGYVVASGFALVAITAAFARALTPAETRTKRSGSRRTRTAGATYVNLAKTGSYASPGSGRRQQQSRSSDDAMMATLWMSDGGNAAPSSHHTTSTHNNSSHSHSSDTGSSHGGHSSCGSSTSSHSCGGGGHSCGGSSCGGGGCGGH